MGDLSESLSSLLREQYRYYQQYLKAIEIAVCWELSSLRCHRVPETSHTSPLAFYMGSPLQTFNAVHESVLDNPEANYLRLALRYRVDKLAH